MPARRSHKKSRAGCGNCKRRRIKCDEVKPICTNCTKHAIVCDYTVSQPSSSSSVVDQTSASPSASPSTSAAPTTSPNPPAPSLPTLPPPPPIPSPPRPSDDQPFTLPPITSTLPQPHTLPPVFHPPPPHHEPSPSPSGPSFTLLDLTLMHHYTLHTASTISNRPEIVSLWRHQIPLLASQHPFLTHALLAVSALHLHHISPTSSQSAALLATASNHHDLAVRGMAATLAGISKENCNALVVSSCLVVIYAFVSSRLQPGQEELATWMPLLRGVHSILKQSYVWVTVTGGPLQALIKQYIIPHPPPLDPNTDTVLSSLYRLCTDRSLPGSEELDDTDIAAAYFAAIAELRKSYATVGEWENIIGSIFTWPITVSDRFVELLVEKRPRALVIFVFYCGLFVGLESFWWSRGSALWELGRVEKMLGPEWEEWTRWPKQRILEKQRADEESRRQSSPPTGFSLAAGSPTTPVAGTPGSTGTAGDGGRGRVEIPEGPIPFDKTGLGAPWGMMRGMAVLDGALPGLASLGGLGGGGADGVGGSPKLQQELQEHLEMRRVQEMVQERERREVEREREEQQKQREGGDSGGDGVVGMEDDERRRREGMELEGERVEARRRMETPLMPVVADRSMEKVGEVINGKEGQTNQAGMATGEVTAN